MAVFFDVEKATTPSRCSRLELSSSSSVCGPSLRDILRFLPHCTFLVNVGDALTSEFVQCEGVTQGSELSANLFSGLMNTVLNFLRKVHIFLYTPTIWLYISLVATCLSFFAGRSWLLIQCCAGRTRLAFFCLLVRLRLCRWDQSSIPAIGA